MFDKKPFKSGSAGTMLALFGLLIVGTGATLHRERALFGESFRPAGLVTQAVEDVVFSQPFQMTGPGNFAGDLPLRRRNVPGNPVGALPRSLNSIAGVPLAVPGPGPIAAPISEAASAPDGAPGVGGVVPLGSGSGGGGPQLALASPPPFGGGGGGSISTTTPSPPVEPPPPPVEPPPPPVDPPPPPPPPPVAVVPEPGTWAMLILGFGLIGGAIRRQRRASVKDEMIAA